MIGELNVIDSLEKLLFGIAIYYLLVMLAVVIYLVAIYVVARDRKGNKNG